MVALYKVYLWKIAVGLLGDWFDRHSNTPYHLTGFSRPVPSCLSFSHRATSCTEFHKKSFRPPLWSHAFVNIRFYIYTCRLTLQPYCVWHGSNCPFLIYIYEHIYMYVRSCCNTFYKKPLLILIICSTFDLDYLFWVPILLWPSLLKQLSFMVKTWKIAVWIDQSDGM